MKLSEVHNSVIAPTFALLPASMRSVNAEALMLVIGLQESRFTARVQTGGPARGFWQFEKGGGVKGVLTHPATQRFAYAACDHANIRPSADAVYDALSSDDILAATFARLLLWTDPAPLPNVGEVEYSWDYYVRNWRPGKPHHGTWGVLYS